MKKKLFIYMKSKFKKVNKKLYIYIIKNIYI